MIWRRSIAAIVAMCAIAANGAALAQACETPLSKEIEARLNPPLDPLLVTLHKAHLLNDASSDLPEERCVAGLIVRKTGDITYGFGQFSLADKGDRLFLQELLDNVDDEIRTSLHPLVRALLRGETTQNNSAARAAIADTGTALNKRLKERPTRQRFIDEYVRRLSLKLAIVQPVWEAMRESNPELQRVAGFVKAYLAEAYWLLGDLDDFKALVEKRQSYLCNLLCQEHILSGFRLGGSVTALDLPRYLHTGTCLAFMPEPNKGLAFVSRFENIILATGTSPSSLLSKPVAATDKYFVGFDLHDVRDAEGRPAINERTFPKLHALRQKLRVPVSLVRPEKAPEYRDRPVEPTIKSASNEACKAARGPGLRQLRSHLL